MFPTFIAAGAATPVEASFSVEYAEFLANQYLLPFGVNLFLAAVIYFLGRSMARLCARLLARVAERSRLDASLTKFATDLVYAVLMMVVVIAALERIGIKTTAAIAVLGAAGLAIGFALQGSLGNFASGVMIITFKPYSVGDLVTVAGHTGVVDSVKVFNTVLVTGDNKQILIPNGQITSSPIINITARGTLRIDITFGVGYGDDLKKAKAMIEGVLAADPRILAEPAPVVAVSELADSSVNFAVKPWVKASDYGAVRSDLLEALKLSADREGISIPYPQRDVHVHKSEAA